MGSLEGTAALDLDIRPLTPAEFDALAELFATGDPRWCWCQYFRRRGMDWSNASWDDNRTELARLAAAATVTGGAPPGLVALRDGHAVGWVSLGPREAYERLAHSKLLAPIDERAVWSIVCFVVAARMRRKGVARALLDGAIEFARARGVSTLEAYPLHEDRGKVPSNSAYVGTQSMFERAGFRVAAERRWNEDALPRPIMRLELRVTG